MNRLFAIVLLLVVVMACPAFAQWDFVKAFPDSNYNLQTHAIAVDPDGKIWIGIFGVSDSILKGTAYVKTLKIDVFNPNGTRPFPPIKTITVGGTTDTLFNGTPGGSSGLRGARKASDGNILFCWGDVLYKLNYKTGAGMLKGDVGKTNSLSAPACDDLGEIFTANVAPDNPINIYSATDFSTTIGTVIDKSVGFSRSFEVSGDGNDIYWAGYTIGAIYRYHSDNGSFGPYVLADTTVMLGVHSESMTWNKKDGYLYVSSGSDNDVPAAPYVRKVWYAYDTKNKRVVAGDTLAWNTKLSPGDCRPRGLAFSPGGDTAYAVEFGASGVPAVQMFRRHIQGVEPIDNSIPDGYSLKQNYPNPFNPSTEIEFALPKSGATTLRVYDVLGREVATLINENLTVGTYKVKFDASRLSSGTYIYTIMSGSTIITKKMMLLK